MKKFTHVGPYPCVLCRNRMAFNIAEADIRGRRVISPAWAEIQNREMVAAAGVGKLCLKFGLF